MIMFHKKEKSCKDIFNEIYTYLNDKELEEIILITMKYLRKKKKFIKHIWIRISHLNPVLK